MKKVFICLSITLIAAFSSFAQKCTWKADAISSQSIPVGVCSWDELQQGDFASSMQQFYQQYEPTWMHLADLDKLMHERFPEYQLHFQVYFGAWNTDCYELLPSFVRYAEYLSQEYHRIVKYDLVAVDRDFKTGDAILDSRSIDAVPSIFITFEPVSGNGQPIPVGEVRGIPQMSLEADIYFQLAHYYKMHQ